MIDLSTLPREMRALPLDDAGRPTPWFAATVDGRLEVRVADARKLYLARRSRLCWVCGTPLAARGTFVIGPMCVVNRVTAEPPCHKSCAEWSAQHCPFLANPAKDRRVGGLDPEIVDPANAPGIMLRRNPGVCVTWETKRWQWMRVPNGELVSLGDPDRNPRTGRHCVQWWTHGRPATRAEASEALDVGAPALRDVARVDEQHFPGALARLDAQLVVARSLLPPA